MSLQSKLLSEVTTYAAKTLKPVAKTSKFLGPELSPKMSKVFKEIKYAPDSKMGKLGIDKVVIRKTLDEGKRIAVFNKDDTCIAIGRTNPTGITRSIIDQLREYVNSAKVLGRYGVKL